MEILPWIIPISGAISGAVAWILTYRNREDIAEAEAIKNRADAASVLTGSALSIVTAHERRIEKLEQKLNLQEETIKYLYDGIMVLTDQIIALGEEPNFKPKPRFRGTNGEEFSFE